MAASRPSAEAAIPVSVSPGTPVNRAGAWPTTNEWISPPRVTSHGPRGRWARPEAAAGSRVRDRISPLSLSTSTTSAFSVVTARVSPSAEKAKTVAPAMGTSWADGPRARMRTEAGVATAIVPDGETAIARAPGKGLVSKRVPRKESKTEQSPSSVSTATWPPPAAIVEMRAPQDERHSGSSSRPKYAKSSAPSAQKNTSLVRSQANRVMARPRKKGWMRVSTDGCIRRSAPLPSVPRYRGLLHAIF
jgi:hypothetical protein